MKPTGISCPHCHEDFNEDQLKRLWAEYCGKQKSHAKSKAAVENGKKGGRPVTYFRDVYNAIAPSIELVQEKLKQWRQEPLLDVELTASEDTVKDGFYLKCDKTLWHVRWNSITNHIEAFQNGKQVAGYNNVNNSSKTSAQRLVEDIHRAQLMSMPEDNSQIITWLKQLHAR